MSGQGMDSAGVALGSGRGPWRALLLGLLVALLGLEGLVRGVGWWLHRQDLRHNQAACSAELRVLCVGESTTYIGGDEAYPNQLQQVLARQLPSTRVSVINCGVPASESDFLVDHIDEWVATYHPQVVIAMMGANDKGRYLSFHGGIVSPVERWLLKARVYRLARYVVSHGKLSTPEMTAVTGSHHFEYPDLVMQYPASAAYDQVRDLASSRRGSETLALCRQQIAQGTQDPRVYLVAADYIKHQERNWEASKAYLLQAARLLPAEASTYVMLADLAYNQSDAGARKQYLVQASRCNQVHVCTDSSLAARFVELLAMERMDVEAETFLGLYQACGTNPMLAPALTHAYYTARGLTQKAAAAQARLDACLRNQMSEMSRDQYLRLYDKAQQLGFRLVCASYANRPVDALRQLFSGKTDVAFVDNQQPFRTLCLEGKGDLLFRDRCYGDLGHGTALGNRYLAENAARVILSNYLGQQR